MANSSRDDNRVTVVMGISSSDGVTLLPFKVNPVTGRLLVTGIVNNDNVALYSGPAARDDNRVTTALVLENGTTTVRKLVIRNGFIPVGGAGSSVSNIITEDDFNILLEDGVSFILTE